MAEVTVKKLAEVVGIPVDHLLTQMAEAGLPHQAESDTVTDEQKQTLLLFLKRSHGEKEAEPKKITLKRKTTSTIKTSGSAGRAKTVNVEVRKKRTYVKRSAMEEAERRAEDERKQEEERRKAEEELKKQQEEARRKAEEEAAAAQPAEEPAETPAVDEAAVQAEKEKAQKATAAAAPKKATRTVPGIPSAKEKKQPEKTETPQEKAKRLAEEARLRAAEEARRKKEEEARRKAEEEAARKTAEEARRLAEQLAQREAEETASSQDEDVYAESRILQQAFEQSLEEENRAIKKGGAKIAGKRGRTQESIKPSNKFRQKMQHKFEKPTKKEIHEVKVGETIAIPDLAAQLKMKAGDLVKTLIKMGEMVTVNQRIDQDLAVLLVEELGHKAVLVSDNALEESLADSVDHSDEEKVPRAPVVTIMGHVDHGKTSLLDYIRRAKVAEGEAGGITQHIGAYHVETDNGEITFLDTPGHAAFTAMRARGASATDIVVVVVAADDGMMPQTEEAINHSRAAGVPIIIAVNKIDKPEADPDRVKNELAAKDVIPEDWGGDTQFVHVSALTGEGVDALLDAILLQADLLELKARPDGPAQGVVLEARMEKGRGAVASVLVQEGKLNKGDMMLAGSYYGRVRAMYNEHGKQVESAGPSIPVELLGLSHAPNAGDPFMVVPDEKKAREVAEFRQKREREERLARQQKSKLENLFANMGKEEAQTVNIVLKADVRGSLEALVAALNDLSTDEVAVSIVSSGVGAITESDVNLAMTSGAFILGFNVRAESAAKRLCDQEGIDLRYYSVIYELIDDVKAAMSGLLAPERREEIVGIAEVKDVFRSSKFGAVAGCIVQEGTVYRNKPIRVLRDDVVVFEGELESLRRFKDDVQEVKAGTECGIAVKSYNDVKPGDKIEVFDVKEVRRTL